MRFSLNTVGRQQQYLLKRAGRCQETSSYMSEAGLLSIHSLTLGSDDTLTNRALMFG